MAPPTEIMRLIFVASFVLSFVVSLHSMEPVPICTIVTKIPTKFATKEIEW